MKASAKAQLGPLLHQSRPSALWKGWLFVAVISWWPTAGWLLPGNEAPLWVFVAFCSCLFIGFACAFNEWAFGVHRIHAQALVVTSSFPFARCRVIPLRTIDPESIIVQYVPLNVYPEGVRWTGGLPLEGPAQRGHPFARWAICFTGASPELARDIARARKELKDATCQGTSCWLLADATDRATAELHGDRLRRAINAESTRPA